MSVVGVIPARYGSTRLQAKALIPIQGKTLVRRVYEQSLKCKHLDYICVATDHEDIAKEVEACGGRALMTSPDHPSGTDRISETIDILEKEGTIQPEIVVNIQGDMPFVHPQMIDDAVQPLKDDPTIPMGTLVFPIRKEEDLHNPAIVKCVTDIKGFAMYFSRSLIPYPRGNSGLEVLNHIGLYVYRRGFLRDLAGLSRTPLEKEESLEQLRVLEHGYKIRVVRTTCGDSVFHGAAIDMKEDVAKAEALLKERGEEALA